MVLKNVPASEQNVGLSVVHSYGGAFKRKRSQDKRTGVSLFYEFRFNKCARKVVWYLVGN